MENNFPEFEDYTLKNQKQGKTQKNIRKYWFWIIFFWKKMYSGVKQGANYVAVKAQPATNKIKKGIVYMGHQVGGVYSNIKHKIVGEKKGKVDEKAVGKKEENNDNDIKNENKEENEIKKNKKKGEEKKR